MNKIILALSFIFIACSDKPIENVVSINEAKKDGFEVIVVKGTKFKTISYGKIQKDKLHNYLIPLDKIKKLSKDIESDNKLTRCFVKTKVRQLSDSKQNICVEFHYSKSTYGYCYEVTAKSIRPLNSSYRDFSENKMTIYKG